ncbi:phytanoyl-CoA dioxygenase family protein [Paraburkholderia jirisanensis]
MPKSLSAQQIEHFHQHGYVAPIRVMSTQQALELRKRLEDFEHSDSPLKKKALNVKSHLLFPWLNQLVRSDAVVNAIEDLYGENLLAWASSFFIKNGNDPAYVSWHQDSTYWGLSKPDVVTAWVALSESTRENGAMQVIPGTHLLEQIPHRDTFSEHNLLTRGQEVAVDVDESQAVSIELEPGEMSLHHVRIVHGSPPNASAKRRIGYAIRYIPTYVQQLEGDDSATLVRGVDTFNTFEHEPAPAAELEPAFVALHQKIGERNMNILYKGAAQQR